MRFETAVFVTTFAFLGARFLLWGRRDFRNAAEQARRHAAAHDELDELFRPMLLFTTTRTVAYC